MGEKIWASLTNELARSAEEAGKWVVAVRGRRHAASGVLLGKDAVVTVNHAVPREEETSVVLAPGQRVTARVAGRDPGTDLAVLRLAEAVQASATPWATTAKPRVGELTLALGRSWRGNIVASSGILSGVIHGPWRTWRGGELDHFVRPDLNLYPGFSGGPLLNAQGEFAGINTAGLHRSAITIPAGTVARVAADLLAKGHVERPYLGVAMQAVELPESLRAALNLKTVEGLLIVHVQPGSPAEKAGLLLGDILIELGGKQVTDTDDVQAVLGAGKVGAGLEAVLIRGGGIAKVKITVEAHPAR
jgi:S1-C subfamily serine protease